jgi:predicted nucleic acid-binding protein
MILLDTCVISETMKPEPDARVLAWVDGLNEAEVAVPALVLGELRRGVELLPDSARRAALSLWLDQLEARFAGKVVSFDAATARRWGLLSARMTRQGTPLPVIDGLLAAHALTLDAVLATRNIQDFVATGVTILNPWS